MSFSKEELLKNIVFKTSRSGGKGGQNVNKVSTKVEINFDFKASGLFSEEEKFLLQTRLQNRLNAEGFIQVIANEERSQLLNKALALNKLYNWLKVALVVQKARKKTKPGKAAVEKRLNDKQKLAFKKINRRSGLDY